MTSTVMKNALAFNQGSDARLAGLPLTKNPYNGASAEHEQRTAWLRGWRDVHNSWGEQRPNGSVALPPIRKD